MRKSVLVSMAALLLAGCNSDKKPTATKPTEVAQQQEEKKPEYTPPPEQAAPTDFVKDDLVFHGLKLGVALKDQLPKCQVRSEGTQGVVLGDGLCYLATSFGMDKGTGSAYVELRRGGHSAVVPNECHAGKCTYQGERLIVHVLPAKSRESGTVESVGSSYPPEQLDNIRHKLEADYGSPIDNNGWIHYSAAWGRVKLTDWKYAISVDAESARMESVIDESVRRAMGVKP